MPYVNNRYNSFTSKAKATKIPDPNFSSICVHYLLRWPIVRRRRSSKASTNSSSDISKSAATPRIVSSVGDLVPFSHLDQVGASTPVLWTKAEYESSKKFSLAVVDELDKSIIDSIYRCLTLKSILPCLRTIRHPCHRMPLVNLIPRRSGVFRSSTICLSNLFPVKAGLFWRSTMESITQMGLLCTAPATALRLMISMEVQ